MYSSKFFGKNETHTEFDREIRRRISRLIVDKMRTILSDEIWMQKSWSMNDHARVTILNQFVDLFEGYRNERRQSQIIGESNRYDEQNS